jgi:hypothetical protein
MQEDRWPTRTEASEPGSWGIYNVGSHYQATTDEDTANWEDLVHNLVNYKKRKLARAL